MSVKNYDDFLDSLPTSGVFDMTDCTVEIWCPELAEVAELERMVRLIESMVHVTDVRIGSTIEDMVEDEYRVIITQATSGRSTKKRFSK
jgi:cell division GTPase FtsZ